MSERTQDSVEIAYGTIKSAILNGIYTSGQHLTGDRLAQEIGVSRTPVREALRRLHAEGLVRVVPNHGAYVSGFTVKDLAEMFALRAVLESYACELATPRLSDADIDRIAELAEQTRILSLHHPPNFRALLAEANNQLHQLIIAASGDPRIAAMIASVTETPLVIRTLRTYSQDDELRSAGHHRELALAFRARDATWAASVMRSHLLAARRSILGETS